MGGSAFSSGPDALLTPRMPRDVYQQVLEECKTILRDLFIAVASPIEGPGKRDFGDIDILVALEKETASCGKEEEEEKPGGEQEDTTDRIVRALGAVRKRRSKAAGGDVLLNLAIPWPGEPWLETDISPDKDEGTAASTETGDKRDMDDATAIYSAQSKAQQKPKPERGHPFIQVDVRICPDTDRLQWMLFREAHGDIWSILGSMIRPLGLTVDEGAMWLRIPEIELIDKKKARVFLTDEPAEILSFLGLSAAGPCWEQPFASGEELYEYIATSRLFWLRPTSEEEDKRDEAPAAPAEGEERNEQDSVANAIQADRKALKSNDRRRMKTRPLFAGWVDDFIPRCRKAGRALPAPTADRDLGSVRRDMRHEAIAVFGVGPAYETRMNEWKRDQGLECVRRILKNTIPEHAAPSHVKDGEACDGNSCCDPGENGVLDPHRRGVLLSALRKIVLEGDTSFFGGGQYGLVQAPVDHPFRDEHGFWLADNVLRWVARSWWQVGAIAWERQGIRCGDALEYSSLKRKAEEDAAAEERARLLADKGATC